MKPMPAGPNKDDPIRLGSLRMESQMDSPEEPYAEPRTQRVHRDQPGPDEPGAWLSRDLLLRAVDLRAIAWNALCAVPSEGGDWGRFWRKLHELREAVNRAEHEEIRRAYAGTFHDDPAGEPRDERHILDEHWRIVPHPIGAET